MVIPALWGAVRLGNQIPPYRLNMCGRIPGLAHLPDVGRGPLAEVLPAAARRGIVVDCRSAEYATAWRPTGELAERTVLVKVFRDAAGKCGAVSHQQSGPGGWGCVIDGVDPRRPEGLAEALPEHFEVNLRGPDRPGRICELRVIEPLV